MPRLRGARRTAQGSGGGQVVSGKFGRLLTASLRLTGKAAGEAEVGQTDRQPVRLRAVVSISLRPGQRTSQIGGDLIERGPPATGELPRAEFEGGALIQAPTQMAGECLGRLACLVEPLGAVLADGFQGTVAGPARFGERGQQALVGEAGEDGREGVGRYRRPAGQDRCGGTCGEGAGEDRDPAEYGLVGFVEECVAPVER